MKKTQLYLNEKSKNCIMTIRYLSSEINRAVDQFKKRFSFPSAFLWWRGIIMMSLEIV